MPPIEMPAFLGAPVAQWRRTYVNLTLRQIVRKLQQRITGWLFLCYRSGLPLAFTARNWLTGDALIEASVGSISFALVPRGTIAFHTWSGLRFKRAELEFILRLVRPGMTFFDVGANIGLFSLAVGQKLQGCGLLYAFEPSQKTFSMLGKNLVHNGLTAVRAERLALSDKSGEATFYVNAELNDALNSLEDSSHTDAEVVGRETVETVTLDEFVARERIARVDLMKVDVEGAELLVFRGGHRLLARPDAPVILYEGYSWCTAGFHYHPVELMWLLEELGFELFVLDSESGAVRKRKPGESYDAMMVAVKRTHALYGQVCGGEGRA
jgi:FkbM family methyltransferase